MLRNFDVEFKQRAVRLVNDRLAAGEAIFLSKAIGSENGAIRVAVTLLCPELPTLSCLEHRESLGGALV